MIGALALHAAAAFVVAGLWISAATLIAERAGTRVGGLIGNLPSNILVALVFVALAQGTAFAADAALAVPAGMLVDALFLLAMVLALPYGIGVAVASGLATWLALALVAQRLQVERLDVTLPAFALVTLAVFLVLERVARVRSVAGARRAYGPREVAARAVFAGGVVATTVVVSEFAGTYWTGLLSTFPAVLLTTMVILARKQGVPFARATGKVLVLGSTNIVVFALVVRVAYPLLGVWVGTAFALAAAVAWVAALRPLVQRVT